LASSAEEPIASDHSEWFGKASVDRLVCFAAGVAVAEFGSK